MGRGKIAASNGDGGNAVALATARAGARARAGLPAARTAAAARAAATAAVVATVIALGAIGGGGSAFATGPRAVAVIDRGAWPVALTTPAEFDAASRALVLVYAARLAAKAAAATPATLGTNRVDAASVRRFAARAAARLAANLEAARASCHAAPGLGCTGDAAAMAAALPKAYLPWLAAATTFADVYAAEQLRLAALWPHTTSEVLTFDDAELTGAEWPDKQFLLTFDDGPTAAAGTTDALPPLLRAAKLHAVFFTLGEALQWRLARAGAPAVRQLYAGQCVASHGRIHVSHQHLPEWQDSVASSIARIRAQLPDLATPMYFRPPYGQRRAETAAFLKTLAAQEMLWNLDSQDWNTAVNAGDVEGRMTALMLLWRRGILLFHDIHPKAQAALPGLLAFAAAGGVQWRDCRAP